MTSLAGTRDPTGFIIWPAMLDVLVMACCAGCAAFRMPWYRLEVACTPAGATPDAERLARISAGMLFSTAADTAGASVAIDRVAACVAASRAVVTLGASVIALRALTASIAWSRAGLVILLVASWVSTSCLG